MSWFRHPAAGKYVLLSMCGVTVLSLLVNPGGHDGWEWMQEQQKLRASGKQSHERLPNNIPVHVKKIEPQDPDRLPSNQLYASNFGGPSKQKEE